MSLFYIEKNVNVKHMLKIPTTIISSICSINLVCKLTLWLILIYRTDDLPKLKYGPDPIISWKDRNKGSHAEYI